MITPQQLIQRNKGLGASDISIILGFNPWRSERDLWAVKTNRVSTDDTSSEAAYIGSMLEPAILKLAAEKIGLPVHAPKSTFVRGILRANVDGMVQGSRKGATIVEAKLTSITEGWGSDMSDEIPYAVWLQVQTQMLCAESQLAYVARLSTTFGAKFTLHPITFDAAFAASIEATATAWWERHVIADEEPLGTMNVDTIGRMTRINGKSIVIDQLLVQAERAAHAAKSIAEELHEEARSQLLAAMGDAEYATTEDGSTVKYTEVKSKRLDGKALTAAHPDIALQFQSESSYRKLVVKA